MLVDLGRNDVGRVSAYGSVKVPTYMTRPLRSSVSRISSVPSDEPLSTTST